MIRKEEVKEEIRLKFGTLAEFARQAKKAGDDTIDRYELQKFFAKFHPEQDELRRLRQLCRKMNPEPSDVFIPQGKVEKLAKAIVDRYETVYNFCSQEPQFSRSSVGQILNGDRKKMTPIVQKLFAHFEIE